MLPGLYPNKMHIQKRQNHFEKGFTLIEVLIAISIFTIGLLAIAMLQGIAMQKTNSAQKYTIALAVASDRMEKLLAMDGHSQELQDTDGDGISGLNDTENESDHALYAQIINGISFDIFWNIVSDYPEAGNKTISLVVLWNDRGRSKRIRLKQVR